MWGGPENRPFPKKKLGYDMLLPCSSGKEAEMDAIKRPIEFLLSKHGLKVKMMFQTRSLRITVGIYPKSRKVAQRENFGGDLNILSHKLELSEEEKQNFIDKLSATARY